MCVCLCLPLVCAFVYGDCCFLWLIVYLLGCFGVCFFYLLFGCFFLCFHGATRFRVPWSSPRYYILASAGRRDALFKTKQNKNYKLSLCTWTGWNSSETSSALMK